MTPPPASTETPATEPLLKILLVDDREENLRALEALLDDFPCQLVCASSGPDALRQLLHEEFAVVLLDVQMPGMSGIEVAEQMRQREQTRLTPILFQTASHSDASTITAAYATGAVDYLTKPLVPEVVRAKVRVFVELAAAWRRLRRADEHLIDLNAQLEHRTTELMAAVEGLKSFSYTVSHDLRAPLRAVDGYARLLVEDYAAQLPTEAQEYLHHVRHGVERMARLIDDILAFSRLGAHEVNKSPFSMADLVEETLAELQSSTAGRKIEFQRGDLPDSEGDPSLIKQVWVNLLSNAIKFTGKRDAALIEIGSRMDDGVLVYFVKDNGAGFDMKDASGLFQPFRRLHGADEFEGTGIGLGIVKRVLDKHGGRIWAEAQPDQGATFWFTLRERNQPQ